MGDHDTLGRRVPHDDPSTVQLEYWRYVCSSVNMEPTGYVRRDCGRALGDVFDEFSARLRASFPEVEDVWPAAKLAPWDPEVPRSEHAAWYRGEWREDGWPDHRSIACYAVTGGSEGYYVHVDVHFRDGSPWSFATIKVWEGLDHAFKIAHRCAELLGA
jgi:hypothetical protein